MLKELSLNEMSEISHGDTELAQTISEYVERLERGERLMVKEKTTAKGRSYVFYKYDNKLYRYQIVGEIFA